MATGRFKKFVLLVAMSASAAVCQAAELRNESFTSFGLGAEVVTYQENITWFGYDLNLSATNTSPIQRSGGYTPITERTGFYIYTASTLDPMLASESWDVGPFGSVQTNNRKLKWAELEILGAYHLGAGPHLLLGMNVTALNFTRSDFRLGPGAAAFNAQQPPNKQLTVASGAISEDFFNLMATVGIRYDSFFSSHESNMRYIAGLRAAIPIYYKVENTAFPNTVWSCKFKGYDLTGEVGFAYKLNDLFSIMGLVEALYKRRPKTERIDIGGGLGATIPTVTITSIRPTISINWNI